MKRTLIIPLVADVHSKVFEYDRDTCMINCVKCISTLELNKFDEVHFVLYSETAKTLRLTEKISADMTRISNVRFNFVLLSNTTSSPAETVYKALSTIGWDNRTIFIKDGDNAFNVNNIKFDNCIITASLENISLVDPQHKSYIKVDEQGFITNCIEKRVISDKFIAGGYSFKDAKLFKTAYENLKKYTSTFYISDIIYWLILNKDEKFLPIEAIEFNDFNI